MIPGKQACKILSQQSHWEAPQSKPVSLNKPAL